MQHCTKIILPQFDITHKYIVLSKCHGNVVYTKIKQKPILNTKPGTHLLSGNIIEKCYPKGTFSNGNSAW